MTTKRLLVLQVALLLGLSTQFLLPKHVEQPEAGVSLVLPTKIGDDWYGVPGEVSQRERDVLGPQTEFARKNYTNLWGDQVNVSIVLSGEDMNTSIHRPERCLPAQGYTIVESHTKKISLGSRPLTITCLHNTHERSLRGKESGKDHSLDYYWFIGSTETTPSHMTRELIDIRDRIFKGTVQRWAYITVTSAITKTSHGFGRSPEEADALLVKFIEQLVPVIEKPVVVNS